MKQDVMEKTKHKNTKQSNLSKKKGLSEEEAGKPGASMKKSSPSPKKKVK